MSKEAVPAPKKGQDAQQSGSLTAGHNVKTQPQHSLGVVTPAHLDGVGVIGGMPANKPAAKKKASK